MPALAHGRPQAAPPLGPKHWGCHLAASLSWHGCSPALLSLSAGNVGSQLCEAGGGGGCRVPWGEEPQILTAPFAAVQRPVLGSVPIQHGCSSAAATWVGRP